MENEKKFTFFNSAKVEEASEGKRLRVAGFLQHYNVRNKNGQKDLPGAYADWLSAWKEGKVSLPLVVMHNELKPTDIVGKFVEIEDKEEGLFGVAEFFDTEEIRNEIIPRVKEGIWPAFSTCGYVNDYEPQKGWDFDVVKATLMHVSLVSLPADEDAKASVQNKKQNKPLNFENMDKKTISKLLRNSLDSDVSEALRAAVEAAIAELEASDVEHSVNEAIEAIKAKIEGLATVEQLADVENALKLMQNAQRGATPYLESEQAKKDFCNALRAGKMNFRNEWKKMLVENAIQDPDGVLAPAAVLQYIADGLKNSRLWGLLNHTGMKVYKIGWNNNSMSADKLQQAGGHKPGHEKPVEDFVLEPRVLRCQSILKLTEVDYEVVRNSENDAILLDYVQDELLRGVIRILEKCVLIGDGNDDANRHITEILPIVGDPWAQTHTYTEADPLMGVMEGIAKIRTEGELVLVADKATLLKLKRVKYSDTSTSSFLTDEQLASALGVAHIVPTGGGVSLGSRIVVFDRELYRTVGDEPESIYGYEIRTNTHVFEQVVMAGGGLTAKGAAVVLTQGASRGTTPTDTETTKTTKTTDTAEKKSVLNSILGK